MPRGDIKLSIYVKLNKGCDLMSVITFDVYKDTIKKHDGFISSTAEKTTLSSFFALKKMTIGLSAV